MQSVPGAPWITMAYKDHRHFANPSVGWANFPPEKAVRENASGSIKRLAASVSDADWTWRAVPDDGTARLTVFISVSALELRTPMNSPLCSGRREKRPREAGFDEGCSLN
ncbi:hypothetical protein [Paraburkholderia sp. C35]|jgi:hypothetical protein|uniref:hypothetical protein n=1 Tax=Paraburkholderia sp. C35 TaxID=2126993 RepID=UPI000D698E84|nr:hypothetical protein [Paraburkholderia sp. C35]